MMPSSAWIS